MPHDHKQDNVDKAPFSGTFKCSVCGDEVHCAKDEEFPMCCDGASFEVVKQDK